MFSPCADFYVDDTKAYLVDGHEIMNGFPVKYLTKQGRKIVTALTIPMPSTTILVTISVRSTAKA